MSTKQDIIEIKDSIKKILDLVAPFTHKRNVLIGEMFKLLVDTYCYGDDLRNYTWSFLKEPNLISKKKIEKHIGTFHEIEKRMLILEKLTNKENINETINEKMN